MGPFGWVVAAIAVPSALAFIVGVAMGWGNSPEVFGEPVESWGAAGLGLCAVLLLAHSVWVTSP